MRKTLMFLFALMLVGCSEQHARPSEALFQVTAWPQAKNLENQSGVAKYITRGKAAYDSCTANVEELRKLMQPDDKK